MDISTKDLTSSARFESPILSQEPGARSQEPGARSQEPGARSQEPGARSQEPGARSQEPGARSQEPGARSQEPGARSQEPGARSQEPGARSQEPGARSQEPGARSQEPGARSQEPGARSQEPGARSQEPGARSQEPGARSQEPGARSQEPGAELCPRRGSPARPSPPSRATPLQNDNDLSADCAAAFACAGSEGRATPGAGQRAGLAVRRIAGGRRPHASRSRDGAQESPVRSVTALARCAAAGLLLTLVEFLAVPMTAHAQNAPPAVITTGNNAPDTNVAGNRVFLLFDRNIDTTNLPAFSDFTVTADGNTLTVGYFTPTSSSLFLQGLSPTIEQGQDVVVEYTDPTSGDDLNAIQSTTGVDAASFTVTVINKSTYVASTVPDPPTGLTATAAGDRRIDLDWTAPAGAISGYKVEWSADGSDPWTVLAADTGSAATEYADTALAPSTTRHYRVSAINSVGTSDPSGTDSATTTADATPPALTGSGVRVGVQGDRIALFYDEALDRANLSPASIRSNFCMAARHMILVGTARTPAC